MYGKGIWYILQPRYASMRGTFGHVMRSGGIRALYKGGLMRSMRIIGAVIILNKADSELTKLFAENGWLS